MSGVDGKERKKKYRKEVKDRSVLQNLNHCRHQVMKSRMVDLEHSECGGLTGLQGGNSSCQSFHKVSPGKDSLIHCTMKRSWLESPSGQDWT